MKLLGLIPVHDFLFSQQQVSQSSCWVKHLSCKGSFGTQVPVTPQLGTGGRKVPKRLYTEPGASCSQQSDPALCHVLSRHVFTQLVQTGLRAGLLRFHFQPPEMPVDQ